MSWRGEQIMSAHYRVSRPQEISAAVNGGCRRLFCRYSAAMRCARAYATRASSSTGTIGAKSRCAIQSSRVNLVMWLETAHRVRYTILRGEGVMLGGDACTR